MKNWILLLVCLILLAACAPRHAELNETSTQTASPLPAASIAAASATEPVPEAALPTAVIEPTVVDDGYTVYTESKDAALKYLASRLYDSAYTLYVYKDFSEAANNFTQKAKIDDGNPGFVYDMNENWQEDPFSGDSAIKCRVKTQGNSWGGWLFVNGHIPEGENNPRISFGEADNAAVDLSGATRLSFMAKGATGGEMVEFFTAGLGYTGDTNQQIAGFPDSSFKRTLGFVTLTDEWAEYALDVRDADLSSIGCGFGFVVSGIRSGDTETVFYLDEIRFDGPIEQLQRIPRFIRSYETDTRSNPDHIFIQNAAFSYDNALAAMAFLSAGMDQETRMILDAFVYAVKNDRYQPDRVRNAYVYGDIRPFPGWDESARLPGWFDLADGQYYEDQYQVGTNVGNSSFVALALLQYYQRYGGNEYLETAKTIMNWVQDNCADSTPGYMAGYDGWPEGDGSAVYKHTYKSIEHNIDAYAAFKQLYALTGEERYRYAYESAWTFIRSMFDSEKGCFYTGSGDDGVTPSKDNIVLDAQVWSRLSLGDEYEPFSAALNCALAMQTEEGGYPFHAQNANGGWWPEGTAFTALTLREADRDAEAQSALDAMLQIQQANGGFQAATVAELSTGFDLFTGEAWTYPNIPHIAPAAWYVLAVNDFNPFEFKQ